VCIRNFPNIYIYIYIHTHTHTHTHLLCSYISFHLMIYSPWNSKRFLAKIKSYPFIKFFVRILDTCKPCCFRLIFNSRYNLYFQEITCTIICFLDSRKPHSSKSILCGFRWESKIPAVLSSYKRCTPLLELETCCANLKSFTITCTIINIIPY